MHRYFFVIVVFFVIYFSGCASKRAMSENPAHNYQKAEMLYQRGRYSRAISYLDHILLAQRGSRYAAKAQLLLAKCYFERGDYHTAISEFRRVVSHFSDSEFVEEAEYMIAKSHWMLAPRADLDQTYTIKARTLFHNFTYYYPDGEFADKARAGVQMARERLAEKEYLATYVYYKKKDVDAVILYSDLFLIDYPHSRVAPDVLLMKAWAHKENDEPTKAVEAYTMIIEHFPGTDAYDKAVRRLENLKN